MADITIGIVASSREWRTMLQAHVRDHVAGLRVQILREPRMALELNLDVVIIDDVSSFLTRDKVVRLREKGTRVVGVYDPEGHEGLGITFLENLGVDLSLPSNISPEEMISAVSQLKTHESYNNAFDAVVADYASGATVDTGSENTVIAVSGPSGSGTTEIAIALADILVARRVATLLLDCDEVGPSVARRLGFHLHPNILSAIDTVNNATRPLTEMVGRPGERVASAINFDVIPGIANPEDWTQLRSTDMADLFFAVRKSWRYIVCNTGPFVEDLSGYGMERFGATRSTLEHADVIIGVMAPTPTGYMRFLDWMASLRTVGPDRPVYVVVSKAPKSGFIRNEIEAQVARDVDPRFLAGLFFVPDDERVPKAEWEGQRVGKGSFLTAVAEIATYSVPMDYSKGKTKKMKTAPIPAAGYAPGFSATGAPSSSPVTVSWNDPDVAQGPSIPDTPQAAAEPSAFFDASHPQPEAAYEDRGFMEDSDDRSARIDAELAQELSQTMPEVSETPVEPQVPADPAGNPYSYSPPMHAVEEILPSAMPAPTPCESVGGDDYVPAFKRGSEGTNEVAPAPAAPTAPVAPTPPPPAPPQYVAQPENPAPQEGQAGSGYVPHFLEEKQKDTDDDQFWGG